MAAARGHDRRDGGLDGGLAASVLREVGWIAAARRDDASGAEGAGSGLFPGIGPPEGPALARVARSWRADARPPGRSVAAAAAAVILAFFATTFLHDAAFRGSLPTPMRSGGAVIGPAADGSGPRGVDAMNRNQILAAVAGAGISAAGAMAQDAVQWRVEDGGNGHWYRFIPINSIGSWSSANDAAGQVGGHLATITAPAELGFVEVLSACVGCPGYGPSWAIGGIQNQASPTYAEPTGGWQWVTGENWSWSPWAPGEPNNSGGSEDFLYLHCNLHGFNDGGDSSNGCVAAIIEWSADCNGDGIIDFGQCRDGSLPDFNGNNIPDCCEQGQACVTGSYPLQWRVEDGGNGHWYWIRPIHSGWGVARDAAEEVGGSLAGMESEAEWQWTRGWMPSILHGYWLGGFQLPNSPTPSSGWRWLSGGEIATEWMIMDDNPCGASPPDIEDMQQDFLHTCCEFYPQGWSWGDIDDLGGWGCDLALRPLIEWSADCNGDGVVDYGQILQGQLVDSNGNGIPDECENLCLADIDGNGEVNGIDLAIILDKWGTDGGKDYPNADIDGDGTVAGPDLSQVLGGWGPCQ